MDINKYKNIIVGWIREFTDDNYNSGSPKIPPHTHDGIDNLPVANVVSKIVAGTNITVSPTTGTGTVTITASGGGGGSPGGSNTDVQFNDNNTFGGSSHFTFGDVTSTTSYIATATTFAPETFTGGATSVSLGDDSFSASITLPFTFNYYGTNYTKIRIGSNGLVGFTSTDMGSSSAQLIPDTNTPNNCIYAFWHDLDPTAGGTIKYQTFDSTPNRKFVVQFDHIQEYGLPSSETTFQVKLFELDKHIEIHTTNATDDAGNDVTQGLENDTGTKAVSFDSPNRNSKVFTLTNDAVRFDYGIPNVLSVDNIIVGDLTVTGTMIPSPGGTPGGNDRNIQFNNAGAFGGNDSFDYIQYISGFDIYNVLTFFGLQSFSVTTAVVTLNAVSELRIIAGLDRSTSTPVDDTTANLQLSTRGGNVYTDQNFGVGAGDYTPNYGGGQGVVFIGPASVIPTTTTFSDGGVLYSTGGALHWLSSSGTDTTIAPN